MAPVKALSALEHVYVFRQSTGGTLQSQGLNWTLGKWNGTNSCNMGGWMQGRYPATQDVFTISAVTSPRWYVNGDIKGTVGGTPLRDVWAWATVERILTPAMPILPVY